MAGRDRKGWHMKDKTKDRHKSGKRRPRVGWGRGKLSMISMQSVKEEEQSSLKIER